MQLELGPIVRSSIRQRGAFSTVVLQLASSFMVGSWMLMLGMWIMFVAQRPSGIDTADLVTVTVREPANVSEGLLAPATADAQDDLAPLARLPGVRAVAPLSPMLAQFGNFPTVVWPLPSDISRPRREVLGWASHTSAAGAEVLGLHFLEGGGLQQLPVDELARGVVLTRTLREQLFPPPAPALGRMVAADDAQPARVLGVVEDVSPRGSMMPEATSVLFRFGPPPGKRDHAFVVRALPGQAPAVAAGLQRLLGPSTARRLVTIQDLGSTPPRFLRFARGLVAVIGLVGLTLAIMAMVGTLALTSFLVAERSRDIGVRRALGGTRWDIVRYFLVESALATALGIALGLAATVALFFLVRGQFELLRLDGAQLAVAAGALWSIATLGALIPALRAARIAPSVAARGR